MAELHDSRHLPVGLLYKKIIYTQHHYRLKISKDIFFFSFSSFYYFSFIDYSYIFNYIDISSFIFSFNLIWFFYFHYIFLLFIDLFHIKTIFYYFFMSNFFSFFVNLNNHHYICFNFYNLTIKNSHVPPLKSI